MLILERNRKGLLGRQHERFPESHVIEEMSGISVLLEPQRAPVTI